MAELAFRAFDADHHYYEHEDAFIRHIDPRMKRRCMQWAEVNGRKRLLVGGKVNSFIPNPTFDPVARPGVLDEFFRGKNPDGKGMVELFGELDPINPAYRDRDARVRLLDTQGLDGAYLFPTLGVGMEFALADDPEAALAAFRAFNRWIEEDWGFAYQLAFHSGDAGYNRFADEWGALSPEPIADTLAAVICHGVLTRHPNVRIATIETGSIWVQPLLRRLKKAYGQMPFAFEHDPVEQFKRNVWVSPYYEDDLETLRNTIGADHVLFGSDYPHAEGLAEPTDFLYDCKGYDEDEIRLVMRENAMGLIEPRPASRA